jgi:hypothetical protein
MLSSAGDDEALALALINHASTLCNMGRLDEARALQLEVRDRAAARGDNFELVRVLNNLCWLETIQGNLAAAVAYGIAGLEQTSENTSLYLRTAIRATLAEAVLEQGEANQPVIDMIVESLSLNMKLRGVSDLTTKMTLLAKASAPNDPRSAAVLIGTARILERRHGIGFEDRYAHRNYVERLLEQLQGLLGDYALTEAIESIKDATFDEATDLAITLAKQWKPDSESATGTPEASEDVPQPT